MRIINTVLGDATGGRWQVVKDYTEVLQELGHEVCLVVNKNKISAEDVGVKCTRVEAISNSGHYDLIASWKVYRIIRDFKADLVIAHCGRSIAVMKRAAHGSVKVIGVSHSNNVKRTVPADAYINISTHIEKEIGRLGGSGKPSVQLPNFIDVPDDSKFEPREFHEPVRIGAIGRFDPVKGFHVMIEALGRINKRGVDFKLILAGDGQQKHELEELVSKYRLSSKVEFVGWVNDVPDFMRSIDMICIPAKSDAFGLTPLEAALNSTPVVLSRAAGHLDMFVDGESAYYFNLDDLENFCSVLSKALNDGRVHVVALNAYNKVYSFYNKKLFTERLKDFICDVI